MLSKQLNIISTLMLGIIAVMAFTVLDYAAGPQISTSIFDVIPIAFVAWYSRLSHACMLALFSTFLWFMMEHHLFGSIPILITAWNSLARFGLFLFIAITYHFLAKQYRREREMAHCDPLTGCYNRRYLLAGLDEWRADPRRLPVTIAYIDLDNFKQINDNESHDAGDRLLKEIGRLLRLRSRSEDVVTRLGGDEFVIAFPNTEQTTAKTLLSRLMEQAQHYTQTHTTPVTLSIGCVTFTSGIYTPERMLSLADEQMYQVKKQRKNDIAFQLMT